MAGAAVQARPPELSPAPPQLQLQQQQQVRRPIMDVQDRSSYGGTAAGVGGKARSAGAVNRRKTPYARPFQGRHASAGPQAAALMNGQAQGPGGRATWLGSGIVGTASKILSSGASYLLSSVFGRRPNAPLAITYGADTIAADGGETGDVTRSSPSKDRSDGPERTSPFKLTDLLGTSSELNSLLKKQTLSSEEYARLTQLLQFRVVDNGENKEHGVQDFEKKDDADGGQTQPEFGRESDSQRWRDQPLTQSKDSRPNGIHNGAALENSLGTPGGPERRDGPHSPLEIARAFMGDRVVRGPGSASPAQGKMALDGIVVGRGASPLPLSNRVMMQRVSTNEVSQNIFHTPPPTRAFRTLPGSSYTPYSRPPHGQVAREVAAEAAQDGAAPSRWTPIRTSVPQSLKRRSGVLDDGWASVGPIRRTKRKSFTPSNTISTGPLSRSFGHLGDSNAGEPTLLKSPFRDAEIGLGLHGTRIHKDAQIETRKLAFGPNSVVKVDGRKGDASRLATVPVQSTETARKILETLDRITSSPMGKLLDDELALINTRPQPPLTTSMLNEHAQRSMQDPGYLGAQVVQDSEPDRLSGYNFGQVAGNASKRMAMVRDTQKIASTRATAVCSDSKADIGQPSEVDSAMVNLTEAPAKKVEPLVESRSVVAKEEGFRMNADIDGSDSDHDVTVNAWGDAASRSPPNSASGLVSSSVSEFFKTPADAESAIGKGIGGFTFPVANAFGNSTEPPPTPKPMPSPAMNGGTAGENITAHVFQFGTGTAQGHRLNFSAFTTGAAEEQGQVGSVFGLRAESQPVTSVPSATATLPFATQALQLPSAEAKTTSGGPAAPGGFPLSAVGAFPGSSFLHVAESPESRPSASLFLTKSEPPPLFPRPSSLLGTSGSFGTSTSGPFGSVASGPFGSGTLVPFASGTAVPFGTGISAPFGSGSSGSFGSGTAGSFGSGTAPFTLTTMSADDSEKVEFATQFSASGLSGGLGTSSGYSFGLSQVAETTIVGSDGSGSVKVSQLASPSTQPAVFAHGVSEPTTTLKPSPAPAPSISAPPAVSAAPISATTTSTPTSTPAATPLPAATAATGESQNFTSVKSPLFTFGTPPVSLTSAANTLTTVSGFGGAPSLFGTSSGGFGVGASTSAAFGAGSTPVFGSSPLPPFPGFIKDASTSQSSTASAFGSSFGANPAANSRFPVSSSKTETPFAFVSSGSGASASGMFQFSANIGTPSSTGFPSGLGISASTSSLTQPTFGLAQPSAFGGIPGDGAISAETGGENTSMEDMAEEPVQALAASAPLSIFQQPSGPPFVFGQPSVTPQPPVFSFSQSQPQPLAQANAFQAGVPNPFAQQALDFGGGGFSVGSGGSETRPGRRIIKPKRTGAAKRGK